MFFDTIFTLSDPFREAVASGCMVIDGQTGADLHHHNPLAWKWMQCESTPGRKHPHADTTWFEYDFRETSEDGDDYWTLGHLIRALSSADIVGNASIRESLSDYPYWCRFDTFNVLTGVRRRPGKLPEGMILDRPAHLLTHHLCGFSADGQKVKAFVYECEMPRRKDFSAFKMNMVHCVYNDPTFPVAFPIIPMATFARLNLRELEMFPLPAKDRWKVVPRMGIALFGPSGEITPPAPG